MNAGIAAAVVLAANLAAPIPPPPECAGEPATIVGTPGDDDLVGTDERDVIMTLDGGDEVVALGGDDLVCGGPGYDVLSGGSGDDVLLTEGGGGSASGREGDDELIGSDRYDDLNGGDGSDVLDGAGRRDSLEGSSGDDVVRGGGGPDWIRGESHVSGDVFGRDLYDGGPGRDQYIAGYTELPVYVDLSQNRVFSEGLDSIDGVEDVRGQWNVQNRIIGDGGANWLVGGGDGDVIDGRRGGDVLDGDFRATDDTLTGGGGDDVFLPHLCTGDRVTFSGGAGADTIDFSHQQCGAGHARVDLREGTMETAGETGTVEGVENLVGSEGPDRFMGGPGPNLLWGKWGADELVGRDGDDTLVGGHGPDAGRGGRGEDVCHRVEERRSCARRRPDRRPPSTPIRLVQGGQPRVMRAPRD